MTSSPVSTPKETPIAEINRLFKLQKENQYDVANTSAKQRRAKLQKFHKAILKYRPAIKDAMFNDFKNIQVKLI